MIRVSFLSIVFLLLVSIVCCQTGYAEGVSTDSLHGKVMCGYQGWFAAEGDGSNRGWTHYGSEKMFRKGMCTFDLWPDLSEFDTDEKFPTPLKHRDGTTAYLFSSYKSKTVDRHFRWMSDFGIDGVFVQRFGVSLKSKEQIRHRNQVTNHVQSAANNHGRTWAVMYDLSGLGPGEIESVIMEDWKALSKRMKIHKDPRYQRHNGKPVVAIWGIGFNDGRRYSLDECQRLIDFLQNNPEFGQNSVMLGVPTHWRTLQGDTVSNKKLHELIQMADITSPWTVGRYRSPDSARQYGKQTLREDVRWANDHGIDFMPVVFPGFSWKNLMHTRGVEEPLGAIPRLKGEFLWTQAIAAKKAGANMIYVAMFDEVDEGTAIFKCTNDPPVGDIEFLTYKGLPSDHYLWLTGKIGELLRGDITSNGQLPAR